MNREQMIEKAAEALLAACGACDDAEGRADHFRDARAVLDAILPQVRSVEELEALPVETVVVDTYGRAFTRYQGWWDYSEEMYKPSELIPPLTVVWQP